MKATVEHSIIRETDGSVARQKIPPDAASRTITHYSEHDPRSVIAETTYDSESSGQDEPEK